jgi:uncharacterized membrane protein YdbT with pleckstrin-like domain
MNGFINGLFALIFCGLFAITLYGYTPAKVERIDQLIRHAEGDADAEEKVKQFLHEHPSPSVAEVIRTKSDVEEILVRKITGKFSDTQFSDVSAQPASMESRTDINPDHFEFAQKSGLIVLVLFLFLLAVYVPLNIYQRIKRGDY